MKDKVRKMVTERGLVDEKGYICYSLANQMKTVALFFYKSNDQLNLPKFMILSLKENTLYICSAKISGAIGEYFGSIDIRRLEYISKSFCCGDQYDFIFHTENGLQIPFSINPTGSSEDAWYGEQIVLAIQSSEKDYSVIVTEEEKAQIEEDGTDGTHPGQFNLSKNLWKKNQELCHMTPKEQKKSDKYLKRASAFLYHGDSQPAMVLSLEPVLVAVYSDEMDAVVVLQFPQEFKTNYELFMYQKLIGVNIYLPYNVTGMSKDIFPGEKYLGRWSDFYPIIAEFISDDYMISNYHRKHIDDALWDKVKALGLEYIEKHSDLFRDGLFYMKKDKKNNYLDQVLRRF